MTRWQIVDLVDKLPEWQDLNGGAIPIEYIDILRAKNKNPGEIAAIIDELANLSDMDALCEGR